MGEALPLPDWLTCDPPEPQPEYHEEPEGLVQLDITIIEPLIPFLEPKRYKVAYGGRGSSKSWGIARLLISRAYSNREKILCCREIQGSITDSVYTLLVNQIQLLGLTSAFEIQASKITCLTSGSVFLFEGLKANVTKIKSFEGVTIVWAEEAEKISKKSWDVLIPTIREPNSEIWISFNPDDDLDETYIRFVEDPPPNCYSVEINYHQNPWFPDVLREEMEYLKTKDHDEYEHIWLGKPRAAIKGAYYATQMQKVISSGRLRNVPYDPTLPVQIAMDLGMADSTVIWFVQQSTSEVRVIDLMEFKGTGLPEIVKELNDKPYRYSQVIVPHDAAVRELGTGKSRLEVMQELGMDPELAPRLSVDDGIMAVKSFLPRCYFDKTNCAEGVKALRRYRTEYNEERKVFSNKPLHDWTSDFADAFRYLAITPPETGFNNWSGDIKYREASKHI